MPFFINSGRLEGSLIVPEWTVILATLTLVLSFVSYLWAPRKYIFPTALVIYLLLIATSAGLVFSTGGVGSSFVSLWMLAVVFATVFGLWGIVPVLALIIGYAVYLGFFVKPFSLSTLLMEAFIGVVPLIVSFIIFHAISRKDTDSAEHQTDLGAELDHASSKAEIVIGAISDGVLALDKNGAIELINPSAQRIIGWGKSDAVGLSYKSVLKLSDKNNQALTDANDPIGTVTRTNQEVYTKEFLATTESGKRIALALVVSPIDQQGQGVIVVFRDITEEKAAEREQAEFISTASHEMRTPVASIEGYLGLALNPNTAQIDEKARSFIEKAHASVQHLGRLFQDLLDVSKADDSRIINHPTVVNIIDHVGDIVGGLQPKAKEKGLELTYKPKTGALGSGMAAARVLSPVYYANVDNDHLSEIINNLIDNAIKYTPKGDIVVDVTGDEQHVKISVQDTGIGIAAEDIPHLFQKFYRIDNSVTREVGGTGLGLYLSRRLSEIMGGRIWVDSIFGKGSTFFLEIPRINQDEADRLRALEAAHPEAEAMSIPLTEPFVAPVQPVPMPSAATPSIQPQPIPVARPQPVVPPLIHSAASPTLAAIEQNPTAYIKPRPTTVKIPIRGQDPTNQP